MIQVPVQPELSAKLQAIVAQLVERNGQYNSTTYTGATVTLRCDAEGWDVRDWWTASPPPNNNFPGGFPSPAPPQGLVTTAFITPTTTPSQCDTTAATMIAAIKAHVGPVFVNV